MDDPEPSQDRSVIYRGSKSSFFQQKPLEDLRQRRGLGPSLRRGPVRCLAAAAAGLGRGLQPWGPGQGHGRCVRHSALTALELHFQRPLLGGEPG